MWCVGRRTNECKSDERKCFKYGKSGYLIADCKTNVPTCYNYGEPGQISTTCHKPKKAHTGGKVFALTGSQPNSSDRLIRGTCYIYDIPLISIIDMGATHSFIFANCVRKVGLILCTLNSGLLINTPANESVTTSLVCLNIPLSIYGKDFVIDLTFLPLKDMDVIMGMN